MIGTDAATGKPLSGIDHLHQSLRDILTTRVGTRVHLREYGSDLPNLLDQPTSRSLLVRIYAATALAVKRWEPRFKIERVGATVEPGAITIEMTGKYLPNGQQLDKHQIVIQRAA